MVEKFIRLYARRRNRTWEESERIFAKYVTPEWRDRSAGEIKRRDVAELLDKVEAENEPVMADRVLAAVRKLFNWIATRDDAFRSPIVKGMARTKPKERARDRVLRDDEIRALWAATETTRPAPFGPLVRCLLLTAQRREEVARMRRREIDGEAWVIPAERYKTGRANAVPLSKSFQLPTSSRVTPRECTKYCVAGIWRDSLSGTDSQRERCQWTGKPTYSLIASWRAAILPTGA